MSIVKGMKYMNHAKVVRGPEAINQPYRYQYCATKIVSQIIFYKLKQTTRLERGSPGKQKAQYNRNIRTGLLKTETKKILAFYWYWFRFLQYTAAANK